MVNNTQWSTNKSRNNMCMVVAGVSIYGERRVCCILTSGLRAPSSHPARRSLCRRWIVQRVPLINSLISLFLYPLSETRERRGIPSFPEKRFYLEVPPPPHSPPPPRHVLWDGAAEMCFGIRRWSPVQRHRLSVAFPGREWRVCGRAGIHLACDSRDGGRHQTPPPPPELYQSR